MLIQSQPTQSFAVSTVESQGFPMMQPNNAPMVHGPRDIVTYSTVVNGSILTVPKTWCGDIPPGAVNDDMLVNVYRFVKSFVG